MTGHLWVIGDSWTDPRAVGPAKVWPALLARRLSLGLVGSGVGGCGYINHDPTYPVQAYRGTGAGAEVVIVWGSVNDRGHAPERIHDAARDTYQLVRAACPGAPLIVCGPQYWHTEVPPDLYPMNEAVREAAGAEGATFFDVLELMQGRPDYIDYADGVHPGPAGHRHIADVMLPEVLHALTSRTTVQTCTDDEPAGGWVMPWTFEGDDPVLVAAT